MKVLLRGTPVSRGISIRSGKLQLRGRLPQGVRHRFGNLIALLPDPQRQIVTAVYRAWSDLGLAVRGRAFSHSEGIKLVRSAIKAKILTPEFLLLIGSAVIPDGVARATISPDKIDEWLIAVENEEKFEKFVLDCAQPSHQEVKSILRIIDTTIPQLRKLFKNSKVLNMLSPARGVKHTDLTDHKAEICAEIKRLRNLGMKLTDIFERIAPSYDKSVKTIERLYYDECEHD
jgi:hypothetical protein